MAAITVVTNTVALERLANGLGPKIQAILAEVADFMEQRAKDLAPVRTGNLRDSINAVIDGWSVQLGSGADYAAAVEFGLTTMIARPYMTPAIEEGARLLWQRIAELFDE